MAKSKYAPALFEVIQNRHEAKPSGGLPVPKWWRSGPAKPQEATEAPVADESAPAEDQAAPAEPAVTTAPPEAPPVVAAKTPSPPAEDSETEPTRLFRVRDGRVELSLTPVQTAVVVGAVLIVLCSSYTVGRHRGEVALPAIAARTGDSMIDQGNQPMNPKPEVLKVAPPSTPAPRHAAAPTVQPKAATPAAKVPPPLPNPTPEQVPARPVAQNRVLIESFGANDKASADFAQQWLAEHQIQTRVDRKGNRWRLLSAAGFGAGDDEKLRQYQETVKALGKECGRDMAKANLPKYLFTSPGVVSGKDVE